MNSSLNPPFAAFAALSLALQMALLGCTPAPSPPATEAVTATPPPSTQRPVDQPAADVPPATVPATELERMDGYGDLRFGMSADAAKAAWGGELDGQTAEDGGCYTLRPTWVKSPKDLAFMIEGDKLVRYDTALAKGTAPGGGKVGMSAKEIGGLYGDRVQATPAKYVDGGQSLAVSDVAGSPARLVFDTGADGVVTAWHVGVPPQVDYVEGCG